LSEVVVDFVEVVGLHALWVQLDLIGPAFRMRPADYESACSTIEIERRQHIPAVHHNPATLLIWR
jgi:hypothetical protein